jgi:purine-binding chemotaxis protein CheW
MSRPQRARDESIDWVNIHERLNRAHAVTDTSPEQARAIMDARARRLAVPDTPHAASEGTIEAVMFQLGGDRYAIETKIVREIIRLTDCTPVPGAPDFVVGITNYRGQVLCVVDLRAFFRAPVTGVSHLSRVIVVGTERVEFGMLADRTDEIAQIPISDILSAPESVEGIGRDYLLGITRQATIILDGATLLSDSRLFVDQRDGRAV